MSRVTGVLFNGYLLSVVGYRSRIGATGKITVCPALVAFYLMVISYRLSVIGYRLSVADRRFRFDDRRSCVHDAFCQLPFGLGGLGALRALGALGSRRHSYSSQNSQDSQNSQNSHKNALHFSRLALRSLGEGGSPASAPRHFIFHLSSFIIRRSAPCRAGKTAQIHNYH